VGHIVLGNAIFLELKSKIQGFPEELSFKIQHMIISHHGEKEFGSPEVPMIPEAYALHVIDLLDSRIKIMEEAIKNSETGGIFSDYINALGRRLYIEKKEGG
jgi:3'-5' exoribonuclease